MIRIPTGSDTSQIRSVRTCVVFGSGSRPGPPSSTALTIFSGGANLYFCTQSCLSAPFLSLHSKQVPLQPILLPFSFLFMGRIFDFNVRGILGGILFMCFFSPIRNDPKNKQTFATHPVLGHNPAHLFMFLCFFFFLDLCNDCGWATSMHTTHRHARLLAGGPLIEVLTFRASP